MVDNYWWVTGGVVGLPTDTTELFTAENDTFNQYIPLPQALNLHNLITYDDSHTLLLGGQLTYSETYIFNMNNNTWSDGPRMLRARDSCQAGLVTFNNGTKAIVAAGGYAFENTTEFLNLDDMTWRYGPDLPYQIFYGSSVQWKNSFIIVAGSGPTTLDTLWTFDVETNEWTLLDKKLTIPRYWTAAVMLPDDYCQEI